MSFEEFSLGFSFESMTYASINVAWRYVLFYHSHTELHYLAIFLWVAAPDFVQSTNHLLYLPTIQLHFISPVIESPPRYSYSDVTSVTTPFCAESTLTTSSASVYMMMLKSARFQDVARHRRCLIHFAASILRDLYPYLICVELYDLNILTLQHRIILMTRFLERLRITASLHFTANRPRTQRGYRRLATPA